MLIKKHKRDHDRNYMFVKTSFLQILGAFFWRLCLFAFIIWVIIRFWG
jgi:flagellar biogenesis protein FliO